MAESSDSQNPFNCPICLHLLKNPVTTTCGHSFCMDCLNGFWDGDDQKGVYSCPQCRHSFSPRPDLCRNIVLAAVVEGMKIKTPEKDAPEKASVSPVLSFAMSVDVECDICTETKLKAIKSCLVCLASYCESHIQTHYTSPALKWHKLANASPRLLDQICSQHHKPLELYCCQDRQLICMQCALINHQNHSMTSPAAERQNIQEQLKLKRDGLQEDVLQREVKVKELKQAKDFYKRSTQAAVVHCEEMFTEQIHSMGKRRAGITKMIRAQENVEVNRVEDLILTLEQEISDMRKRHDELGQLSHIEDNICFIQNFSSISDYQYSNLCAMSISQHLTFEQIETTVSELKSQLDNLCEQDIVRISEKDLPSQPKTREEFLIYSSDLNLNPSSSCNGLSVNSNKSVTRNYTQQHNFSNQGLFGSQPNYFSSDTYQNYTYQVLCNESLSGRCYFEVQWAGKGCSIAFSYDQFLQGGGTCRFGSDNRSWKCDFPTANVLVCHDNRQTSISWVSKIGVFLDQEVGTVFFYNVSDKMTLLHQIQTTFTEPLYAGFSFQDWEDYSSVTICDLPSELQK